MRVPTSKVTSAGGKSGASEKGQGKERDIRVPHLHVSSSCGADETSPGGC